MGYGIGSLFCSYVRGALRAPTAEAVIVDAVRRELELQLAALVRFGVSEAGRLEADLA